ncbi:hypothetical protein VCR4J2_500111 [Vibrio coralliirubri]|uniref:polysaccharide pyruvyl transferase family protein n=1 Tax=Vibrio coralliirubri TaxID=1516159 RepID=UPI000631A773|nr:polysaccharide pyruvyl transferase family protein [Vibrio coralliirubri]CDT39230.1 hypothetical protein VCR4J2_500111 [Vibrio coralliirubri]
MKLLVIGAGSFVSPSELENKTLHELLKQSGGNSGNYMIGHGSQYHINEYLNEVGEGSYIHVDWTKFKSMSPSYIENNFDRVILCGANMVNIKADFGFVYNKLSQTTLPIFAMGVGAQSESSSELIVPPRGTVKLFELISERSHSIGVRGDYTAAVFKGLGINNVTVNGCPSYYINKKNANFKIEVDKNINESEFKALVTMKRDRNKYASDSALAEVQRYWLMQMIEKDYKFLIQTDFAEAYMAFNKETRDDISFRFKKYFKINDDEFSLAKQYLFNNAGIFFDYTAWHDFICDCDFAFGARFHGNMTALMSGIPSLTITHDTRTQEFCDLLNLPSIDVFSLVNDGRSIFEHYQSLDYEKFNSEYHTKCDEFDQFFKENMTYI